MAISGIITAQTGGRQFVAPKFTKYSLFVGGVNSAHHALINYTPLMNGFTRQFIVRGPKALIRAFAGNDDQNLYSSDSLWMQVKHLLEYMNQGVSGFQDLQMQNAATPIQGGFAGRQFNTPTVLKDTTESVTIRVPELIGSPVYTVIYEWMNMIGDENSGLATYHGWINGGTDGNGIGKRLFKLSGEHDEGIDFNEANHTMEMIHLLHDRSGAQVERAALLTDMYPTGIQQGVVMDSQQPGQHDNIFYDITFNCNVYRGPIITSIADDLLKQFRIVSNSLNYNPQLGDAVYGNTNASTYTKALGEVPNEDSHDASNNIGNVPVYSATNVPDVHTSNPPSMVSAKIRGQDQVATEVNDRGQTQGYAEALEEAAERARQQANAIRRQAAIDAAAARAGQQAAAAFDAQQE